MKSNILFCCHLPSIMRLPVTIIKYFCFHVPFKLEPMYLHIHRHRFIQSNCVIKGKFLTKLKVNPRLRTHPDRLKLLDDGPH